MTTGRRAQEKRSGGGPDGGRETFMVVVEGDRPRALTPGEILRAWSSSASDTWTSCGTSWSISEVGLMRGMREALSNETRRAEVGSVIR